MDLPDFISTVPKRICWCCVAGEQQTKQYFNRLNSHFPLNGHYSTDLCFSFALEKKRALVKTSARAVIPRNLTPLNTECVSFTCQLLSLLDTEKQLVTSLMQTQTASMLKFSGSFWARFTMDYLSVYLKSKDKKMWFNSVCDFICWPRLVGSVRQRGWLLCCR